MAKLQFLGIATLLLFISSCTHVPKDSEEQVADIVQKRIGKEVQWNQTCYEDPGVAGYIQDLLFQPISIESAVQIALLNNPEVQATFEEIGIAQADLIEAGLFTNPVFSIEVRYPNETKLRTNIEYLITTTFLDIFLIPLRKRLASVELEQAKLRVANVILDLAFEVRRTYYELAAEQQMLKYTQTISELTSIQNEIAIRQHNVGNVNQLDFEEFQAIFLEANLQIAKSEEEITRLREKLNRLLGLSGEICLTFPEQLPEGMDYQGFDLCRLKLTAIQERIDLQVARFEILRLRRMLGLKDWWTYTQLQAGFVGERDPDGSNLVGPGFAGEIPVFNYGQAARMRLYAQLRQAQDRLAVLEIRVLSEVTESHKLLMKNLKIINKYREGIIPLQNKILSSSEELYNVMGLGVDRLLTNKRRETETYRNYLASLRDYWIAQVRLDHALGGYLFRLLPENIASEGVSQ